MSATLDALIAEAMATAKRLNATLVRIEAAMMPTPETRYFMTNHSFWKCEPGGTVKFRKGGDAMWANSVCSMDELINADFTETTAEHAEP